MSLASGNPLTPVEPQPALQPASPPPSATVHIARDQMPADHIAVHYIDVDQGAAALLEFPCGAVMIDTGGQDQGSVGKLVNYLTAFFARRPDLHRHLNTVFITHTHIDHNRGLKQVSETFDVGGYVYNGLLNGSGGAPAKWMAKYVADKKIPTDTVTEDQVASHGTAGLTDGVIDSVSCPRVDPSIKVLSGDYQTNPGWTDGDFDNGNNHSLVIRVDYGKASFLFTGDLEEPAIDTLVDRYAGTTMLQAEVYAVGHHGSANGTTESLLGAVRPEIAVMSMGRPGPEVQWSAWAYGHPRRSIVELLDGAIGRPRTGLEDVQVADGAKKFSGYTLHHAVYGTGWDGNVTVLGAADGNLQVETGAS